MKKSVRERIPKIEKSVKEFVRDESGAVTKDNILKAGIVLGFASFALVGSAAADHSSHTNSFTASFSGQSVSGQHTHHGSHTSY
jgi:hypothetical protein